MRPVRVIALLGVAGALLFGCGGGGVKTDPILRLSSEEALEIGKRLMEKKRYPQAREHFDHAFQVAPNSASGREALLLAADSHFLDGGRENLLKAESKYRDFQTRFPTSARSDYVQHQIAQALTRRMYKPDRDQSIARSALEAYQALLSLFPTSEYTAGAEQQIAMIRDHLAEHEFRIAFFYLRYGNSRGTISRLESLLENYPDYPSTDRAIFVLGRGYLRNGQPEKAAEVFERLRREHPDSPFVKKIPTGRLPQ